MLHSIIRELVFVLNDFFPCSTAFQGSKPFSIGPTHSTDTKSTEIRTFGPVILRIGWWIKVEFSYVIIISERKKMDQNGYIDFRDGH